MHASLFCRAWCPLVVLDHQRIFQNHTSFVQQKVFFAKEWTMVLGCSSPIILVTFDDDASLAHSSGVALLQIAVNLAFDLLRP